MKKENTFITELQENVSTGDLMASIPPQVLSEMGWYEGTELRWVIDGNELVLMESWDKKMAQKTSLYHIYVNNQPVHVNLDEDDFKKQYSYLVGFLELTNLKKDATIEYEECETILGLESSY